MAANESNEPIKSRLDVAWSTQMEMYHSVEELAADPAAAALRETMAGREDLSERFDCQMRWDAMLFDALHDVEVPEGLAGRVLDRLHASVECRAAGKSRVGVGADAVRRSRRWWLVATSAAAVVGAAAVTLRLIPWRTDLSAWKVGDWLDAMERRGRWRAHRTLADGTRIVRGFPIDQGLRLTPRKFVRGKLGGRPAVLYQGATASGHAWALAVVRVDEPLPLPSLPPQVPVQASSGSCGAAWQNGGLVYVLRLRGTPADYRSLVKPGIPLA